MIDLECQECQECQQIGEYSLVDIAIALNDKQEEILSKLLKLKKEMYTKNKQFDVRRLQLELSGNCEVCLYAGVSKTAIPCSTCVEGSNWEWIHAEKHLEV